MFTVNSKLHISLGGVDNNRGDLKSNAYRKKKKKHLAANNMLIWSLEQPTRLLKILNFELKEINYYIYFKSTCFKLYLKPYTNLEMYIT